MKIIKKNLENEHISGEKYVRTIEVDVFIKSIK